MSQKCNIGRYGSRSIQKGGREMTKSNIPLDMKQMLQVI
jgi:hypothetical protein